MWLRAETANQNLKLNAQTRVSDCIQTIFFVIYDTVTGYISTIILLPRGLRAPKPLRLHPRNMQHLKTKTAWDLLPFAPCESVLQQFTLYLLEYYSSSTYGLPSFKWYRRRLIKWWLRRVRLSQGAASDITGPQFVWRSQFFYRILPVGPSWRSTQKYFKQVLIYSA